MCTVIRPSFVGIHTENGGEKKPVGREPCQAVSDDTTTPEWTPVIVGV